MIAAHSTLLKDCDFAIFSCWNRVLLFGVIDSCLKKLNAVLFEVILVVVLRSQMLLL